MWAIEMFYKEDKEGVTLRHENNNAMSFINGVIVPELSNPCAKWNAPSEQINRLESAKGNVLTPLQAFDWVKYVGKWRESVAGQSSGRMDSRCAR